MIAQYVFLRFKNV